MSAGCVHVRQTLSQNTGKHPTGGVVVVCGKSQLFAVKTASERLGAQEIARDTENLMRCLLFILAHRLRCWEGHGKAKHVDVHRQPNLRQECKVNDSLR